MSGKVKQKMFEEYPDVLNVAQMCELLHIGKRTAYGLLKERKISHRRIGRIYHIPKSSVIAFITQDEPVRPDSRDNNNA